MENKFTKLLYKNDFKYDGATNNIENFLTLKDIHIINMMDIFLIVMAVLEYTNILKRKIMIENISLLFCFMIIKSIVFLSLTLIKMMFMDLELKRRPEKDIEKIKVKNEIANLIYQALSSIVTLTILTIC